jgi:acetoin utilization deacetylase AcuC-like enzyme
MSDLLMVEQRHGGDEAPWVLEGGQTMRGHESDRRLAELRRGLTRHEHVHVVSADASDEELELTLQELHEPGYLAALRSVRSPEPIVMPELAPPGLAPDMPVCADLVVAAHEGMRTAISAAHRIAEGARFTYALCRPPGHHAGPNWLAGYCYLNNAAGAVRTLLAGGVRPVGVLDLDLHYPNGTSAIVESMPDASLHSLHAWPVVLSLGYDIVAGDPHGSWGFSPGIFAQIGRLLADCGLPVCVVQEGGYALDTLADCSSAFAAGLLERDAA